MITLVIFVELKELCLTREDYFICAVNIAGLGL